MSEDGQPLSTIIDHVEYILHESFENPRIVRAKEPFMLQEKGWGAFDLRIIFHFIDNMVAPQLVWFDLNFAQESYFKVETLTFENPPDEFLELLNIPTNGIDRTLSEDMATSPAVKRKRRDSSDESSVASSEDRKRRSSSSSIIDWDMAITSPLSGGESSGADEYQPKKTVAAPAAGKTTKKVPKNSTKNPIVEVASHIEDDVYTAQDAANLHNVHRMTDVSPEIRKEWGVPENVDMCELARALTMLNTQELQKCYSILQKRHPLENHVKGGE
ncbi:transcription factor TFIIF complex subunit Tfg3 [Umbelopsis sp. WA50703]